MIAANVACFYAHGALDIGHPWVLEFGTAPNPLEWLSSMFAHDGIMHLLGNMYFLAAFGLIVEGKLGFRRFVVLYLAIGLIDSAVTQLVMWPFSGAGAVGASSAIMGLMAICLVWAPKNELSVFMVLPMPIYLFRVFWFDVSIMAYASFYVAWELFWLMIHQFSMSTPALHLIGITIGFAAGTIYVKRGWVDCENWDLFAVMAGTHGRFGDPMTTVGSHADASLLFGKDVNVTDLVMPEKEANAQRNAGRALRKANRLIDDGMFIEASEEMFSVQLGHQEEQLSESQLRRLATGLLEAQAFEEAEFFLQEYVERFDSRADWCRLRIAQLQLRQPRSPRAALRTLKQVRLSQLSEAQQQRARKLAGKAKDMIRQGVQDRPDEY